MEIRVRAVVPFVLFLLVGCSISEQKEIEMGRQTHGTFEKQSGGLYPDSTVQQYVNAVGMQMARYAGRPNLDWQFAVVNSDQINAFAVPGGYIYITQGLLFRMSNEAELAGVLGHEAGHIALRHSVKQIERQRTAQGASFVAGIVGGLFGFGFAGDVASLASNLTLMKYSRGQEQEADYAGLGYMTQGGYDPRGMVQLMEVLQDASGGKGPPQFLSTHPNPGNRLEYLNEAIQKQYAGATQTGTLGEKKFQQYVASRRPLMGGLPLDLSRVETWCLTCRARVAREGVADRGGELLHEVAMREHR